jgi:hypothetical protein
MAAPDTVFLGYHTINRQECQENGAFPTQNPTVKKLPRGKGGLGAVKNNIRIVFSQK